VIEVLGTDIASSNRASTGPRLRIAVPYLLYPSSFGRDKRRSGDLSGSWRFSTSVPVGVFEERAKTAGFVRILCVSPARGCRTPWVIEHLRWATPKPSEFAPQQQPQNKSLPTRAPACRPASRRTMRHRVARPARDGRVPKQHRGADRKRSALFPSRRTRAKHLTHTQIRLRLFPLDTHSEPVGTSP
jgi:hypothetical protein